MPQDAPVRCTCGKVQGTVVGAAPERGNRVVCYCGDCQAFARFLERTDVLDEWGGTHIFQVSSGDMRIDAGMDQLRCVRLSEKGLYRWYAGCCNAPLGNMIAAKFPFFGALAPFVPDEAVTGPPIAWVHGRSAKAGVPAHVSETVPLWFVGRAIKNAIRFYWRRRGKPHVFFDAKTGRPIVEPRVLTREERAKATPARRAV